MSAMVSRKKKAADHLSTLKDACQKNLPLDVRLVGNQTTEIYRSRFLNPPENAESDTLLIEAPTSRGSVVLLRPGQEIKLIFAYQGIIHSFTTEIVSRGRYQLSEEVTVRFLKLQAPETLATGKIRSFYRLAIPGSTPLELSLGVFAKQKGKPQRIRAREKAIITDIGGGGLGFRIPEGRSLLLGVDTRLSLNFHFPDDEEPMRLLGRICFYLRRKDLREVFFGVQFIEVDSGIDYKRSVDRILRYVAEKQRMLLKNRINVN
jgi:c-di-GMP-binding flagellar brake protein YcgR